MSRFLEVLKSGRVLLMDGAMGTELQRAGLRPGECGEMWNLHHRERVGAIHRAYADSGAEVLLTNTFQVNAPAFVARGLRPAHVEACWIAGLSEITTTVHPNLFVLGDVGPIIDPETKKEFADLAQVERLCRLDDDFPVRLDAILIETGSSPGALDAARSIAACRHALLSLTYLRDSAKGLVTLSGHPPEWFAERARKVGIAALGVNCGREISIADCAEIVRRYRAATDLPLFARPNAGTPIRDGERWVYPRTPEQMAADLPKLLEAGVRMVGGCCGTTPAHIAAFREVVDDWNARRGFAKK